MYSHLIFQIIEIKNAVTTKLHSLLNLLVFSQKRCEFLIIFFPEHSLYYSLEMVIMNIDFGFRKLLIPQFNNETFDTIQPCNKH